MAALEHHKVAANGIELHLACQGEGPLVLMCHGFPGLWYSWRHQLPAIAAAGYRAVAMDMRGYGRSSRPASPDAYGFDSTAPAFCRTWLRRDSFRADWLADS